MQGGKLSVVVMYCSIIRICVCETPALELPSCPAEAHLLLPFKIPCDSALPPSHDLAYLTLHSLTLKLTRTVFRFASYYPDNQISVTQISFRTRV